jgi:hypothetical protein
LRRISAFGSARRARKRALDCEGPRDRGTAEIPGRNVFISLQWTQLQIDLIDLVVDPSKGIVVELATGLEVFSILDVDNRQTDTLLHYMRMSLYHHDMATV